MLIQIVHYYCIIFTLTSFQSPEEVHLQLFYIINNG